jgi:hypothetical protein
VQAIDRIGADRIERHLNGSRHISSHQISLVCTASDGDMIQVIEFFADPQSVSLTAGRILKAIPRSDKDIEKFGARSSEPIAKYSPYLPGSRSPGSR